MVRFRGSSWHTLLGRLVEDPERSPTLRALAERVCEAAGAERATVFAVDATRNLLHGVLAVGMEGSPLELPLDHSSIAGCAALEARTFRIDDVTGDLSAHHPRLRFLDAVDRRTGFTTRSVLAVPVRAADDRVIGVLEALNSRAGAFGPEDQERLEDLAAAAGIVLHVSALYDDIKQLRQLERRKSDFIDMLVHELKEPVAAIQMLAEFGVEQETDAASRTEILARVAARAAQVNTLVGELLEVSRVKRGLVLGQVTPVDLARLAGAVLRNLEDLAERRGVTVTLDAPEGLPPTRLDDALAPYLFTNYVSNALKYTDGGGAVTVTLRAQEGGILAEVADNGIGVPPNELRSLFKEFYRASNARARGVDGTGLGLVTVKEIAERYGGRVGVESTLGKGSRFWFWMPADPAAA